MTSNMSNSKHADMTAMWGKFININCVNYSHLIHVQCIYLPGHFIQIGTPPPKNTVKLM